jgi:hypothetical protein
MRKLGILVAALLVVAAWTAPGQATPELFEYALNLDGVVSNITLGDAVPAEVNSAGFNATTGLGNLSITVSGAGAHYVALFVDHDVAAETNTFLNEFGAVSGAAGAGLSWEIDEPGYVFGDIYANFTASDLVASALDNTNALPAGSPDDVSMALGWNFILAADETGVFTFTLNTTAPGSFYLAQTDPGFGAIPAETVYFATTGVITGGGEVPVPEPSTLVVVGTAFGWLALLRKRMKR